MTVNLTFGSLFAGIGGFDLGFERAGMVCKWQVEKDPFCLKVLAKHWPNVRRHKDVRKVGKRNLETVDVICGGFPCQPHSIAGKRKGSTDERDLWGEFARIIGLVRPQWVVVENVPGLLSSEFGRYFGRVLRDLVQMGYDMEWGVIPASYTGALHKRARVFIVAYTNGIERKRRRTSLHISKTSAQNGRSRHYSINSQLFSSAYESTPTIYNLQSINSQLRRLQDQQTWLCEPGLERMANGIPYRVDRLRSLGNAVVPQVAHFIATLLIDANNENQRRLQ